LRVAIQRFDDAVFLFEQGQRNTGAIYLAGYTVECTLKALLLSCVPKRQSQVVLDSFRGKEGHSIEALRARYARASKTPIPPAISKALSYVNHWTTDLRYEPGDIPTEDVEKFLQSAESIMKWSRGRL
jgi:HEPN domain-containing protein